MISATVPTTALRTALGALPDDVSVLTWSLEGSPPARRIDLVVVPYMSPPSRLLELRGVATRLVQGQSIGFDGVAELLPPGQVYANAAGVHEASTAELAVALVLASQRGIPDFVRAQGGGRWAHASRPSLADRSVLIVGYGGVGRAIEERLHPFETRITRVASRARVTQSGPVHGVEELPSLLRTADVVILSLPLGPATTRLMDGPLLAAMPDDALLVNVSRGGVVDTPSLVAELRAGRLRAALDVTDPEPLPPDHPLWGLPGVLISPHVGGASSAMMPRMARLIRRQLERLRAGEEPLNVVLRS